MRSQGLLASRVDWGPLSVADRFGLLGNSMCCAVIQVFIGDIQTQLAPGVLRPITEQDSTDFEKCLRRISAPEILGFGFLGARVDHLGRTRFPVVVRHEDNVAHGESGGGTVAHRRRGGARGEE